ncbi:peptidoglycan DD-metalloendopeptidase family protein [Thioalkalivibrio sp. ALJT]|uniref:peptidoglycan DD-metalloendopeptidase family protein n=1 Tax=Thioalkalivibrio sp. ALJT TaxID=1158146 RepID=UPI000375775C|nr:peptidoglycan DD-metalloendopeptidase family protein [Thioalkalivibrio sp. ALJT]
MRQSAVEVLLASLLLILVAGLVAGCAARAPGVASVPETHVVQRDETLYRIARRYGLEWRALAERNAISAPYLIYPGQRLRLRGAVRASPPAVPQRAPTRTAAQPASDAEPPRREQDRAATSSSPGPSSSTPSEAPSEPASSPAPRDAGGWHWPADGEVLRTFSSSGTRRGVGIGGERGDDVRATRAGEVVYAGGGLVGYGRLIILKHDDRFLSAYGHNDELLVSEGDQVQAGQTIARLGSSGSERPMLHFEIRVDGSPVDPARYLPER